MMRPVGPRGAGSWLRLRQHDSHLRRSERWRWRESNPRPSTAIQGFSGRNPLCFSRPRQSRRQAADGPSRCWFFLVPPRPGHQVEPPSDARSRVGGDPGLTDFMLLLAARQRERSQRGLNWRLLVSRSWLTRSSLGSSARFPCLDDRSRNRSPPVQLSLQGTTTAHSLHPVHLRWGKTPSARSRARAYPPRPRRATARSASRLACCSASACRLSYVFLPRATAISTLALPSLK